MVAIKAIINANVGDICVALFWLLINNGIAADILISFYFLTEKSNLLLVMVTFLEKDWFLYLKDMNARLKTTMIAKHDNENISIKTP